MKHANMNQLKHSKIKNLLLLLIILTFGSLLALPSTSQFEIQAQYDLNRYWDWCFWCNGLLGPGGKCGRISEDNSFKIYGEYYALTRRSDPNKDSKDYLGGPSFGPAGSCAVGSSSATKIYENYQTACASLQKDQYVIGHGAASTYNFDENQLKACDNCIDINAELDSAKLTVVAQGISDYPKIVSYPGCDYDVGCARIDFEQSKLKFKFIAHFENGTTLEQETSSNCVRDPENAPSEWSVLGHDPRDKRIRCTAETVFENIPAYDEVLVRALVINPVANESSFPEAAQANDNCTQTLSIEPPPAPQCLSVSILNADGTPIGNLTNVSINQQVKLKCSANANGNDISYAYRLLQDVQGESRIIDFVGNDLVSESYVIKEYGQYYAQCAVCWDGNCDFEKLNL